MENGREKTQQGTERRLSMKTRRVGKGSFHNQMKKKNK
jgi:hypothetical protein